MTGRWLGVTPLVVIRAEKLKQQDKSPAQDVNEHIKKKSEMKISLFQQMRTDSWEDASPIITIFTSSSQQLSILHIVMICIYFFILCSYNPIYQTSNLSGSWALYCVDK